MEKNLQGLLEKLSHEVGNVRSLSNNLQNARASSVRNSIRLMDCQVNRNIEVHEGHLREVETRHREVINSKVEEFEKRLADISKVLGQKDEELEILRDRLRECRKAKQSALEENVKTKERYQERNIDLERCLNECKQKLLALESEKVEYEEELAKAEGLQQELEESKETVQCLHDQLKRIEEDIKVKEDVIEKLEEDRVKLQTALKDIQNQNEDLSRQLSEILMKSSAQDNENVKKVLEERLNAVQKECEDLKAILKKEEAQHRELSKQFSELEYEHKLKKVDLRIAEREKKELAAKLEVKESLCSTQTEQVTALQKVNTEISSRLVEVEEGLKMLTENLEEKDKNIQDMKKIVDAQKEQNCSLELENVLLKKELEIAEVKLRDVQHLQTIIAHKDEIMGEKNKEIGEKDRVIKMQKEQIGTLKELAMKMEEDMEEFNRKLDDKLAPLAGAEKIKNLLEVENRELREKLNKCRVELNEAKSLKTYTEKRLQQTESSLKVENQSKESLLHERTNELNVARKKNEEFVREIEALTSQVNHLEKENFELKKKVEVVTSERDKIVDQYSSCCQQVYDTKQEVLILQNALQKAVEKGEFYKESFENGQRELGVLKDERKMEDVKNSTKIEQQKKLIEYLVAQLDALDKKKHTRGIFPPRKLAPASNLGRDPLTPSSTPTTTRTEIAEKLKVQSSACPTPTTALEQEQLALNWLEKKRDNLRNQLETMNNVRNVATTPARKTPTLPTPARKPDNILKERANTISGATAVTITGKNHRFLETTSEKDTTCCGCRDTIKTGRYISQCVKCLDIYHRGCSPKAGGTCLSS